MFTINARNVRNAYAQGMALLRQQGVREESRAGPVLVLPCPVMTVYEKPCERVLVDPLRDANPFFHLAESLWMLTGRRDADFLNRYIGGFGQRFAETRNGADQIIHDAYGYRWRKHFGYDQLKQIVTRLRENPQDRQCVLQMWDATLIAPRQYDNSLYSGGANDLRAKELKTRPCNTHVYFRVHNTYEAGPIANVGIYSKVLPVLDMTVCCRSNDMIFGGYGANAVHFSVLQEYLAARIGVGVGRYYQLSNNFHAYTDVLDNVCPPGHWPDPGGYEDYDPVPLVTDPATFDDEVRTLLAWVDAGKLDAAMFDQRRWTNAFIPDVALPLLHAHAMHRQGLHTLAAASALRIRAPDWERAAVEWLERRKVKREAREFARTREEMTDGRTVCHN